jgi:hypothetical protein
MDHPLSAKPRLDDLNSGGTSTVGALLPPHFLRHHTGWVAPVEQCCELQPFPRVDEAFIARHRSLMLQLLNLTLRQNVKQIAFIWSARSVIGP